MRILVLLFLAVSIATYAEEQPSVEPLNTDYTDQSVKLNGAISKEELVKQFEKIQASGLDTSQPYKWEFRFTSNVMSSLEDFAQTAHLLDFWPVALESDTKGETYWLYIQKTHQYDQDEFVYEVDQLFKMAEYRKLNTFDGFSIDSPDTASTN
ncbi:ribonuclease E inhibitor RraB [Alteromonas oceanisediminis]|uniref:ribonuclease E inhibitor RraB n=1 Tax=Alteromonas oceanisediminis TaxID=2836180 RepID=UPI001BDA1F60|nr:ribonuclease E inhibitor RraB [Alteromonas oceanisediminis]MBT0585054.1 ribonuclease E inhibitor RraB [Alteromonas oceanisediminis]